MIGTASITLIQAKPEDAPLVARLHISGWQDGYADLLPQSYLNSLDIKERTQRWRKSLSEGSVLWIAKYADEPAALIGFGAPLNPIPYGLSGCGEVTMIYTLGKFYRHGIGNILFNHARTSLKSQGFKGLYLWVLEGNIKGRSFYEKMGGSPVYNAFQITDIDGVSFKEMAYYWTLYP